jgi:3-oxoacyl-[acyl-carrier-protein] synthase III
LSKATNARLVGFAVAVPGERLAISALPLSPAERERLPRLQQEIVYRGGDPTALMIEAAASALTNSGRAADDIGLVITAPSLLTMHGLEIPAIAIKNQLGLRRADTLHLQQGCNGILKAIDLANDRLRAWPTERDILIVTGCAASAVTDNLTHGSFFWSDGAGAAVVTSSNGPGFAIEGYAEASAAKGWDAMRVPFDAVPLRITLNFASRREQANYIDNEAMLFANVLTSLLDHASLQAQELGAIIVPATGANRLPVLFGAYSELKDRVITDFRCGHMGGVDVLKALGEAAVAKPVNGFTVAALTASFTAQWGGVLLRWMQA